VCIRYDLNLHLEVYLPRTPIQNEIYTYNLFVKAVKNVLNDFAISLFPKHKIALLMQCVKSITNVLLRDISLMSDRMLIRCY
jgi:hypothetical protein